MKNPNIGPQEFREPLHIRAQERIFGQLFSRKAKIVGDGGSQSALVGGSFSLQFQGFILFVGEERLRLIRRSSPFKGGNALLHVILGCRGRCHLPQRNGLFFV